jgi:hypothetical protein
MDTVRLKTIISQDGKLFIKGLPFHKGEPVEVIVRTKKIAQTARYPLRGKPIYYTKPFDSVAKEDWEALK